MASDGFMSIVSAHDFAETLGRLEGACLRHGFTVFARMDHAAAAASVGLAMRPTRVLFVGNPKAGTPLMRALPQVAIDLPLRLLLWEDDEGRVLIGTNAPAWLMRRHADTLAESPQVKAMQAGLSALLSEAAGEMPQGA